jgi:hypothetical protein
LKAHDPNIRAPVRTISIAARQIYAARKARDFKGLILARNL